MPFMVIDGHNIKIDNNAIDAMNQFIQDDIQTSSEEEPRRQSRSRDDGTYGITTLDPDYFKKYHLNYFTSSDPHHDIYTFYCINVMVR